MNRILKHIVLFAFVLLVKLGFSQQDPMFTNYMNSPVIINPAYAGSSPNKYIDAIFRKQWIGMDWNPTTTTVSFTTPFRDYRVGIGGTFLYDEIGPMSFVGFYADYAYHLRYDNQTRLSLGLKGGFDYYQINLLDLRSNEYDPYVAMYGSRTRFLPNFGVGAYYYGNRFFLGVSIPKLLRNSLKQKENTLVVLGKQEQHLFFTGGYLFDIDDPFLRFKPTYMVRVVRGSPITFDLSGNFIFYDQFWAGLTYRYGQNGNAIAGHVRAQANEQLQIGISYDFTTSPLRKSNSGTYEIYLSYTFTRRGQIIRSPRYF